MATTMAMSPQVQIPVIDLSVTSSDPETQIAEQLVQAAMIHGFLFIKNFSPDISVEEINHTFDLSKIFFDSPLEDKEKCAIKEDNHGWVAMHSETLDSKTQRLGDFKEAYNLREFSNGKAQQPLPASLAPHEAKISNFVDHCHALCLKLLTLFGLGLHIDQSQGGSTWFSSRHACSLGPSGCILRLLYYPSVPEGSDYQPDVDIRAGAHSDYGSITLLFQRPGQPGLEILTSSGAWAPVPVFPPGTENDPSPPILVNMGDLFSYWTNGLLRSTVHRVIFPKDAKRGGEDRYSIAYFCHPADKTVLEPVPSKMVSERAVEWHENDGRVITAKEHLIARLKATYLQLNWDHVKGETEAS